MPQPTDDKDERPREPYRPPSRWGRKALTAHVDPRWVVNLKVYGALNNRSLQSLVEEAMLDLAGKLGIDLTAIESDAGGGERPG